MCEMWNKHHYLIQIYYSNSTIQKMIHYPTEYESQKFHPYSSLQQTFHDLGSTFPKYFHRLLEYLKSL